MVFYEVGKVIEKYRNHDEGTIFDIDDFGATLHVFFKSPTEEEIEQFETTKDLKIKFLELYGVIMISIKFGNLKWMDAPYTPHLSINLTDFDAIKKRQGLVLNVIFIDAAAGVVKKLRWVSLPKKFSRKLFSAILEQKEKEFDIEEYAMAIKRIYSTYTIEQIAKMGNDYL